MLAYRKCYNEAEVKLNILAFSMAASRTWGRRGKSPARVRRAELPNSVSLGLTGLVKPSASTSRGLRFDRNIRPQSKPAFDESHMGGAVLGMAPPKSDDSTTCEGPGLNVAHASELLCECNSGALLSLEVIQDQQQEKVRLEKCCVFAQVLHFRLTRSVGGVALIIVWKSDWAVGPCLPALKSRRSFR